MDIKDINKGLVVYDCTMGFLIVDDILEDGMVSCNNGHVITFPQSLHKVDKEMLDERKITQADLDKYGAHI